MKYVLIITPQSSETIMEDYMLGWTAKLYGADRLYRIYRVKGCPFEQPDFTDVDGSLLVGLRIFDSQFEAMAYAEEDVCQRTLMLRTPMSSRPS